MVELSVIIPTYNERENLAILIPKIAEALSEVDYEILVVDDSSPDGTAEVARSLSKYRVRVIVREGERGLSSAVVRGFKEARGNVLAVMDADLQHPPEKLPEMYSKILEGCDVVIASRYVKGGSVKGWSILRKVVSKGAILLAHLLVPKLRGVKDLASGYFMLRREVLEGAELDPKGFKILLEVLMKGSYRRVCEVPYTFGLRRAGSSKLGAKTVVEYLLQVLEYSPRVYRFALVGALGTLVNLAALALLRGLGLPHLIASPLAIEVSVLNNFYFNDLWTFKDRRGGSWFYRLLKYHLANLTGILSQFLVSVAVYSYLTHESISAQFMGIVAGFLLNYGISKAYVWK